MSKRLLTNKNSTVTVYISSHAGEEFIKIQDTDVITTEDIARALGEMRAKGRYKQMAIFLDTCRAITFFNSVEAPNIVMLTSSGEGEDSKSHVYKEDLGVYTNDIFSHGFSNYMRDVYPNAYGVASFQDIYEYLTHEVTSATVKYKNTFPDRSLANVSPAKRESRR